MVRLLVLVVLWAAAGEGCLSSGRASLLTFADSGIHSQKEYKSVKSATDAAGACGLAFTRCAEIVQASSEPIIQQLERLLSDDALPQAMLQVLHEVIRDFQDATKQIFDIASVGTNIAAGLFNKGVSDLRDEVIGCNSIRDLKPMLSV